MNAYYCQSITYDAQGNPTSYLGHTLTWEKGRQLKSFDNNTYTYNANGIRTSKTVNGVKHEYILDGTKILKECWNYNETTKTYNDILIPLYDNEDSVCGIIYNNTPYYFQKNLQGDVICIVDKDAEVVARYTYDAWGKIVSIKNGNNADILSDATHIANINPFRYRAYYYDAEIGLYYLSSRYYDPEIGRFLNADDPILCNVQGEPLGSNLYAYCLNNPVMGSDPTGKLPIWAKVLIGIAGITAAVVATVATGGAALPALIATLKYVAGSMAINMAISGLIGWITGGASGLKKGLKDGAISGFMWGGIGAAVSAAINIVYVIRAAKSGKILRYTKHGLEQAFGRDGGRGVSDAAIRHTIKNPTKIKPQSGGKMKLESNQAVVVLNKYGQIITTWAKSRKYWR